MNIRGATGVSKGRRGILRDNMFGSELRAIHYPDLPASALLSTQGLKLSNWETHHEIEGDYVLNRATGTFMNLTIKDVLPTSARAQPRSGFRRSVTPGVGLGGKSFERAYSIHLHNNNNVFIVLVISTL